MRATGLEFDAVRDAVRGTLREMFTDRGYHGVHDHDADTVACDEAVALFVAPDDTRGRVGIHQLRELCEQWPGRRLVAVAHEGATSYLKNNTASSFEVPVEVFHARALVRNVTQHVLVPAHEAISHGDALAVLAKYGFGDTAACPKILTTDPVARYYAWAVGTVVRIGRRNPRENGTVQACTTYRVVARP